MTDQTSSRDTLACPFCTAPNPASARFCEMCGRNLSSSGGAGMDTDSISDTSATVVVKVDDVRNLAQALEDGGHVVGFKTDIGLSHHVNQDAGGVWTATRPDGTPASLVVVADGVSAGRNSEGASRLTVDVICAGLQPLLEDPTYDLDALLNSLIEAARDANHQVAQRPHHAISSADATTLVAALCVGHEGAGIWCGDSRVYRISGDEVIQLTRDHSWAEGVVSHGIMTEEAAARDPRARMITRWLGPPDQEDPGLESFRVDLDTGDTLLCCTDGLYLYLSPPAADQGEIARILASHDNNLDAALDEMVALSLQRGGRDNITGGAIRVQPGQGYQSHKAAGKKRKPSVHDTVRLTFERDRESPRQS